MKYVIDRSLSGAARATNRALRISVMVAKYCVKRFKHLSVFMMAVRQRYQLMVTHL